MCELRSAPSGRVLAAARAVGSFVSGGGFSLVPVSCALFEQSCKAEEECNTRSDRTSSNENKIGRNLPSERSCRCLDYKKSPYLAISYLATTRLFLKTPDGVSRT